MKVRTTTKSRPLIAAEYTVGTTDALFPPWNATPKYVLPAFGVDRVSDGIKENAFV